MSYRIVAFHTPGPYALEAKKLEASLVALNLPYKIYEKTSRGSWNKNINLKPEVLLDALNEFPNEDLVYLDVDCTMQRHPVFFDRLGSLEFEIAAYYFKSDWNPRELLTGTLYLKNTEMTKKLIEAWKIAGSESTEWDQILLQRLIEGEFSGKIRIVLLPPEYIKIHGMEQFQKEITSPVITHFQASRRYRRIAT